MCRDASFTGALAWPRAADFVSSWLACRSATAAWWWVVRCFQEGCHASQEASRGIQVAGRPLRGRGAVDVLRSWIKSNRGLLVLLLGSGIFRTAVADWNSIPSGFMQPALQEGKWCSSIG